MSNRSLSIVLLACLFAGLAAGVGGCAPQEEFEGYLKSGPEWVVFSTHLAQDGQCYWVDGLKPGELDTAFVGSIQITSTPSPEWAEQATWVRLLGKRSSRGRYGHLDGYDQKIVVSKLLDIDSTLVSETLGRDCLKVWIGSPKNCN